MTELTLENFIKFAETKTGTYSYLNATSCPNAQFHKHCSEEYIIPAIPHSVISQHYNGTLKKDDVPIDVLLELLSGGTLSNTWEELVVNAKKYLKE